MKRFFDFTAALFGLVLLSPLLLLCAILIKRESPGPAFYRGIRIGKEGKPFRIFKFRTMVPDAENLGGPSTAGDDPRLLKIGNFLKKYQLDELPQLINVLKGGMSLVGPRPDVIGMVELLIAEEKKMILSQIPGMVDLSSLWNFNEGERLAGKIDPHKVYLEEIWPTKKRLQIYYIQNRSTWLDIRIIFRAVFKIFGLNWFAIKIHVGEEVFNL
ncbi:MAG: sugar transferase [Parcubacteria group bacterium Gr01-1014_30]|nr:MAG: sugar transferase [Parcubacteria group bacterium Gr01-1014_30]